MPLSTKDRAVIERGTRIARKKAASGERLASGAAVLGLTLVASFGILFFLAWGMQALRWGWVGPEGEFLAYLNFLLVGGLGAFLLGGLAAIYALWKTFKVWIGERLLGLDKVAGAELE